MTESADLLIKFYHTMCVNRLFCSHYPAAVVNEVLDLAMFSKFPNVVPTYPFRPYMYLLYKNKRLPFPICDDLSKYHGVPEAFFGDSPTTTLRDDNFARIMNERD